MAKLTGNIEHFTFSILGVGQKLKVVGFSGSEKISAPFRYVIELACDDADLDFNSCINKPALLTLIGDHDDIERHVHGMVLSMQHVRQTQRFAIYSVELVPQLAWLKLRSNSRIYQNTSVPDILASILKDGKIGTDLYKLSLKANYDPREYCVQYRETDLQFIERLMEEEGIYYYFEHSKDEHRLIITDNADVAKTIGAPSTVAFHSGTGTVAAEDAVRVFVYSEQVQSGAVTLRDFNFKKPALGLQSHQQVKEFSELEMYDYPGGYDLPGGGDKYAQVRLEALQAATHKGQGESNCLRLLPGFRMTLDEHPRKNVNQEYLLTKMTCEARQPQVLQELASGEGTSYNNKFTCIPSSVPYRTTPDTAKPHIDGVQTAIVVGPAGEEIYVDEFGRVKVQFHWDRQGKNNEKSSCWIRVSQTMAGAGWGALIIPRVGHEVIVDFIEGNPDRPIVLGQVYHGTNKPPYPLPEHKTRSTIKSNSTKGGGGSNELRFEDKKGSEEIYLHAQKDWTIAVGNDKNQTVGHDETLDVTNNRTKTVGVDQSETIGNNKTISVGVNHDETIGANKTETIGANMTLTVGSNKTETVTINTAETIGVAKELTIGGAYQVTVGAAMNETIGAAKAEEIGGIKSVNVGANSSENVGGNKSVDAGKDITEKAGKKIVLTAGDEITLKCGDASISMKKDGTIVVKGKDLTLNGSGKINIKASGDVVIKGSKVGVN